MNNKQRKLFYIRYKNKMKLKGYKAPKWTLVNRKLPFKWLNNNPALLELNWIIDLRGT
jgi:hypothetical protein